MSLTTQTNTPPSDGAVTAAAPFRRMWKYIEAFWVRDRLGRWLKYIGPKDGSLWNTDPATGRETPNFPIVDAYDSRTARDPRYKARVASQKLDDGSVIFEVARNSDALGRGADPTEADYDSISRDLPRTMKPGQTAFVRRDPKTVQLTDDAAKMGGRARLAQPTREGRATIGQPGVENVLEEEAVEPWSAGPEDFLPRTDDAVDLLADPAATTDDFGPLALASPETREELARSMFTDEMFDAWLEDLRVNSDFEYNDGQQAEAAQDFFDTGLEDVRAYLDDTLPENPTVDDVEQAVFNYMRGEIPDLRGMVPASGPLDEFELDGIATVLNNALDDLNDAAGDGDVDQMEELYLEDGLDLLEQAVFDSDPGTALERIGDGLEFALSATNDPIVEDALNEALIELAKVEERRGTRATTDAWGPAYTPFATPPTDWPLEPESWAGTQTGLPPGGYALDVPPDWADTYPGAVLSPGDSVEVEYDWDGNLADLVLPEGVADLPDAEREALEGHLGLRQSDLWSPDGTATASTPASALPVWSEMFTPDELAGWSGNDDDPAVLYSDDGRWVLDADPDSVGAEDQVLLFDNETGIEQRLPLDDPELDDILARPRRATVDAWEGSDAQVEDTASVLHENWRANRLLPDGTFEPRMKDDGQGGQVDIANTPYADLPEKWQAENRAAARAVVQAIRDNPDADMEALADIVHQDWMERNGSWAPPEQMLPYAELSEENKDLDRDVVRAGLQILGEPSTEGNLSATARNLEEDMKRLKAMIFAAGYDYLPSDIFDERDGDRVGETLDVVSDHLSYLATGEPPHSGYDPKDETSETEDPWYDPERPEGLTPEQDAVWSAMRMLANLENFTRNRGEETVETQIQEPLRRMYQALLDSVGDDRFDAAAVEGRMEPNYPATGQPAEERATLAEASDSDYLDSLEDAISDIDPLELPPEVGRAVDAVDGVTDDDGSIADDATSAALDEAAEALDDADVAIGTADTPQEENLSGALQDAADTLDAAADNRMVQEDAAGTRPPREALSVLPSPMNQYVTDEERAKFDAAAGNAYGRYTSALAEYQAGMKRGDEEYAAERLHQMQQAFSDLSAEMMESDDPEDQLAGRKMRAANRKLGTALRKAQYPKTKIDRRQQPKARARREAAAVNREERARISAIRRKVRGLQRSSDLGLTPEQQAAFDGLEPQAQLDLLEQHLDTPETPFGDLVDTAVPPAAVEETAGEVAEPEVTDEQIAAIFNQLAAASGTMRGFDDERRARANQIIAHILDPANQEQREQFEALTPLHQRLAVTVPAQRTNIDPVGAFDIALNRLTEREAEYQARYGLDNVVRDILARAVNGGFDNGEGIPGGEDFNDLLADAVDNLQSALEGNGDVDTALTNLQDTLLRAISQNLTVDGVLDDDEVDLTNRLQQTRLDRVEAAAAATPTSSTNDPNRATVVDAIGRSQASTTTQRRAETAVSTADIAESVNIDPAVNRQRINQAAGDAVDPATSDALAQANNVTAIGEPDGAPSVTAAEAVNSAARAQHARDLSSLPLEVQAAEVFAVIEANPELRRKVDNYLFQQRPGGRDRDGNPKPPRPSLQSVISNLQNAGDLTPKQRRTIGNELFFVNRHFHGLAYQAADSPVAGTPEMRAAAGHVADRVGVLLDSYLLEYDVTLHNYTVNQDVHAERIARLERVWAAATATPADTGWWYMDDYTDGADYTQETANLDAVLNTLGGPYVGPIVTFAIDSSPQTALVKARKDLTGFIRQVAEDNPNTRFTREEALERAINHLNRVGGSNYDATIIGLRDDLIAIRNRAHGHDNAAYGTPWDASDDLLQGIRDGLIRYQGSNRGRMVTNAKSALDDALSAEPGSERRWSSLARVRNELDILHARELVPAMNAMRVRVDEDRLRDLGDISQHTAQDNDPPSRPHPRGQAWTVEDLQALTDVAGQLEQEATDLHAATPQLQQKAAGLLRRAVRAYDQGKYGQFEQLLARSMSRLAEANDVGRLEAVFAAREAHWEPNDWAGMNDSLKASLIQHLGYLPTNQQVAPQDGDLLDAQRDRQDGRALLAEGLSRPPGSVHQRTHFAAALWFLNQADDPRDAQIRDMLRPWDPNGDILSQGASPINPNDGGSTVPVQSPGDARIARAQQAATILRADGFVMRATLADRFGMELEDIDGLFQGLVNDSVFATQEYNGDTMYYPGPRLQESIDGRPMTGAEWDDVIQQAMAGTETATTTVQRQNPAEHTFHDPRITVNPDGSIGVGDQITASWNEETGSWGWVATGRPGPDGTPVQDEVGSARTLEELEVQLSGTATARGVPFPAAGDGDGEVENPYQQAAATVASLAERVSSEIGDTDTAATLDSVHQSLTNGDAATAIADLERAAASLLDNAAVLHSALTEDTGNYDPDQNLVVGDLYAQIRRTAAGIPQPVDMETSLVRATQIKEYASERQQPIIQGIIDQLNQTRTVSEAEALRTAINAMAEGDATYDERRALRQIADHVDGAINRGRMGYQRSSSYRTRDMERDLARLDPILTPEQRVLVDQVAAMHSTDATGAYYALRQVSLDMLEQDGVDVLPVEMFDALRSSTNQVSGGSGYYGYGIDVPAGLDSQDDIRSLIGRFNQTRNGQDLDAAYQAAHDLLNVSSVAATNPSYSVQQRRDFASMTARAASQMDIVGRKLAQANAIRDPDGDIVRRPPAGTPGIPEVNGMSLLPGDVIRRNGQDYLYQGAVVDEDGRYTASVVNLQTAQPTTLRQQSWGGLADQVVSASPQAANPTRHWGRLGSPFTPERLQELTDQFGSATAQRIDQMMNGDPWRDDSFGVASLDQIFDADAPLAVREQAAYDLLSSSHFAGMQVSQLAVDLSAPNRMVVNGSLEPTRAGTAPETFTWEMSRAGDLPPVSQVQFSGQPVAAARAASAQQFLRDAEQYTIGNGGTSIQLSDPSPAARVSAANAGYDWDDVAMGGFENVRTAVQQALQRVARGNDPNTGVQAAVEQMFRDAEAATDVDGLPTPFEIANVNPSNPKIGQRAIAQTKWTPMRNLTGPSRMIARQALIEQRRREVAQQQRAAGFAAWGEDRVPALVYALTELPAPDNIGYGDQGRRRLGSVMNVANDTTLQPGQPGLTLRVSSGSMDRGHRGDVRFNVFEFVEPGKRDEVRRVGSTDLAVNHYEALVVLGQINEWQKAHKQKLPAFSDIFGSEYGKIEPGTVRVQSADGSVRRATMDDLQRVFNGDMKKFRNQVATTRQTWNLEAMSKLHDFQGVQMTHPQLLRAYDALWKAQDSDAGDVQRAFADAGVDTDGVAAILRSGTPSQVESALSQILFGGSDSLVANLLNSGRGEFGFNGDEMYAGLMKLDPATQGGGMATLLQSKFSDWGIAHEVFKSVTVNANIDVGSYAWGLIGFGFRETGEGRRGQAQQMLSWLYGANPTDDERAKLDELRDKINTGDPYSESFPNPYDIISTGMIEAYVNGTRDWVGKRGMIGHNRGWMGRMILKPDRLYHQAIGLRQMQAAMREASLANQRDRGVPGSAVPSEPAPTPGLGEAEAQTMVRELNQDASRVPMLRRVFTENPALLEVFRDQFTDDQRAAALRIGTDADDFRDAISALSGGPRASSVAGAEDMFDQVFGEATPAGMGRLIQAERVMGTDGARRERFVGLAEADQLMVLRKVASSTDDPTVTLDRLLEWAVPEATESGTATYRPVAEQVVDERGGIEDPAARERAVGALTRFFSGRSDLAARFGSLPVARQQTILRETGFSGDDPTGAFVNALQREYGLDQADLEGLINEAALAARPVALAAPLQGGTTAGERNDNLQRIIRSVYTGPMRAGVINQPWFDQDRFNQIVANGAASTWRGSEAEANALRDLLAWQEEQRAGGAASTSAPATAPGVESQGGYAPGGEALIQQAQTYIANGGASGLRADRVRLLADEVARDERLLRAWNSLNETEQRTALDQVVGGSNTETALRAGLERTGQAAGPATAPSVDELLTELGSPEAVPASADELLTSLFGGPYAGGWPPGFVEAADTIRQDPQMWAAFQGLGGQEQRRIVRDAVGREDVLGALREQLNILPPPPEEIVVPEARPIVDGVSTAGFPDWDLTHNPDGTWTASPSANSNISNSFEFPADWSAGRVQEFLEDRQAEGGFPILPPLESRVNFPPPTGEPVPNIPAPVEVDMSRDAGDTRLSLLFSNDEMGRISPEEWTRMQYGMDIVEADPALQAAFDALPREDQAAVMLAVGNNRPETVGDYIEIAGRMANPVGLPPGVEIIEEPNLGSEGNAARQILENAGAGSAAFRTRMDELTDAQRLWLEEAFDVAPADFLDRFQNMTAGAQWSFLTSLLNRAGRMTPAEAVREIAERSAGREPPGDIDAFRSESEPLYNPFNDAQRVTPIQQRQMRPLTSGTAQAIVDAIGRGTGGFDAVESSAAVEVLMGATPEQRRALSRLSPQRQAEVLRAASQPGASLTDLLAEEGQ